MLKINGRLIDGSFQDRTPETRLRFPLTIGSHAELTELMQEGRGFVFNNRADRKMLHRVTCESLEAMVTSAYEKFFFEDLDEGKNWLDKKYGVNGWVVCGRCRPTTTTRLIRAVSRTYSSTVANSCRSASS
jgi:hypothetical protein